MFEKQKQCPCFYHKLEINIGMGAFHMQENQRRVVMLRGTKDKWYEQAIFILRDGAMQGEMDCLKEAERIVNGHGMQNILADKYKPAPAPIYLPTNTSPAPAQVSQRKSEPAPPPKRNKRFDSFLNISLIVIGIAVMALIAYHFM